MNSEEINKYLSKDKFFIGTFSIDTLPIVDKRPITLIVNTDPSTRPGEHWIAIYLKEKSKGIYFDSYGFPPLNIEINNFMDENCRNKWKYNNIQIQPADGVSNTCGNYCILFCKSMSEEIPFKRFLNFFSKNYKSNDSLAEMIFK
jgi:hypothetical protein